MAKRRHSNRRRRRGGAGFFYKLLSLLLICGAVVTALTLFFRVDEVLVMGQQRYSAEEIRKATGVNEGDNLFLLNKHEIAKRTCAELPYIDLMNIDRKFPDTLVVRVQESQKPLAVIQDGTAWLVSPSGEPNGKIVERLEEAEAEEYGRIDGCTLLAPSVGTHVQLSTELELERSGLLGLMKALADQKMMEDVDAIHLGDPAMITVDLYGRITVQLRYDADFSLKIKGLRDILETGTIQENMRGTLDMRSDNGRIYFSPTAQ